MVAGFDLGRDRRGLVVPGLQERPLAFLLVQIWPLGNNMGMTVAMLVAETLSQKNARKLQAKCAHDEIFSSGCTGPSGTFTTAVCMDCGKTWRSARPHDED